ncbi:MAG TPA: peroxiredoxin-like family protein [Candidatus Sulfotelmatobacter sp.]|nr:peroxiredoxin-like family protein [Candidatus Sulfotelmatobacter sp.]
MPTLNDRLAMMREKAATTLKPEVAQLLERHLGELRTDGAANHALTAGDVVPAFALLDLDGNRVSSAELLSKGPLVVSFYRGTWCPFCNEELKALNDSYEHFRHLGASLVVITPQSAASAGAYRAKHDIAFPMLVDPNADVAERFGLAYSFPAYLRDLYRNVFRNDLGRINAAGTWRLPIPARYVIDRNGTIVDAQVNADYRYRPDPEETLAAVAALTPLASCASTRDHRAL